MGGLISGSQSVGGNGVPVLGWLPGIGRLFCTDAVQEDRTELMVMVTPYVIADHEEGWELTRWIRAQLRSAHRVSAVRRSGAGVRLAAGVTLRQCGQPILARKAEARRGYAVVVVSLRRGCRRSPWVTTTCAWPKP